jgi:cytochrome c oxidase subunit 3
MPSGLSERQLDRPKLAHRGPGGRGPVDHGPDDHGGGGDHGGDSHFTPGLYQIGIIVALFSVAALFIALVLAYGLQLQKQTNWQHIRIPVMLWISTALLAASSLFLETGRSSIRRGAWQQYNRSLGITVGLGVAFLASQLAAWLDLKQQGVYVSANLHGSMFFVFTGMHGAHLLIGILWLIYLVVRSRRLIDGTEQVFRQQRALTSAFALYWHFMGVLWVVLFALLHLWS